MTIPAEAEDYGYGSAAAAHTSEYLWPTVERVLAHHVQSEGRVFDLGCGNGALAAHLTGRGYRMTGVDPSREGIEWGRRAHPDIALFEGSAYEPLAERFGTFPAVVSLEVVEHVYAPRAYAATPMSLVELGGIAIVSTPYHGYLKNVALALSGKMDAHFTALWDHGHIKFWSVQTLTQLLVETGFETPSFHRVGRVPAFAKSMIAVARRP